MAVNSDSTMKIISIVICVLITSFCNAQIYLNDVLSDILSEFPHQVYSDEEREEYKLDKEDRDWIMDIAGDSYVLDSRSVMGVFCDNVYELYHDASIDLSSPLKRKLFEKTDTYIDWMDELKKISYVIKGDTLHAPLDGVFRYQHKYDIEKGRFVISCSFPQFPSIGTTHAFFYVPKDLKPFFHSSGFSKQIYVNIENETVALEIENTENYGKHPYEFLVRFFYNGPYHDDESINEHDNGNGKRLVTRSTGVSLEIYDIILYKTSNHQIVWSMRLGDLSNTID
ncbi:MAG: hypothetical protein HDR75_06405 [Bacteroides sp.]|nr:hypothetical protein [Bacteroides sp.]